MKTYVVNMAKDTQKRAAIESQLESHPSLKYEIFQAIEGRKLSEQQISEMKSPMFDQRYRSFATLPALGCSLSHYYIYKDISEKKITEALILEDDAILSPQLEHDLDLLAPILAQDMPVAILLTPEFCYKKSQVEQLDGNVSICRLQAGLMTSGYLINHKGAELLKTTIFPIQYLADAWKDFVDMGLQLHGIIPHAISYPHGLGEIGLSQHTSKRNGWKLIRYRLGYLKGRLSYLRAWLLGYRMSKKRW